jgi:hypothetical protein
MKVLAPLTALIAAIALAGCGSGGGTTPKGPPGSPDNPVPAKAEPESAAGSEGAAKTQPGYAKLLQRQGAKPKSRFTPCNLVTKAQAGAYLRTAVAEPREAPLGPTCIYVSRDGKSHVTLAVTSQNWAQALSAMRKTERLQVSNRRAACGQVSGPTLYVSLRGQRLLTVGGPCVTAMKFATTAVGRLEG